MYTSGKNTDPKKSRRRRKIKPFGMFFFFSQWTCHISMFTRWCDKQMKKLRVAWQLTMWCTRAMSNGETKNHTRHTHTRSFTKFFVLCLIFINSFHIFFVSLLFFFALLFLLLLLLLLFFCAFNSFFFSWCTIASQKGQKKKTHQ